MNNFITQDLINMTVSTIAAMLVVQWLSWLISRIKAPSGRAIGQLAKVITMVLPILLNVLRYALLFGFFGLQLHDLVTAPGPLSRWHAVLIAFWVFWANGLFVVMMFELKLWKVDRLLDKS
ncbi:MAG: hypothetical protein RL375_782 [Pseudomonadota bacterium]|jgi:hypothetical protein